MSVPQLQEIELKIMKFNTGSDGIDFCKVVWKAECLSRVLLQFVRTALKIE